MTSTDDERARLLRASRVNALEGASGTIARDGDEGVGRARDGREGWRRSTYVLVTLVSAMVYACGIGVSVRGVDARVGGGVEAPRRAGRGRGDGARRADARANLGGTTNDAVFLTYADRFSVGGCVVAESAARQGVFLRPLGRGEDERLDATEATENVKTRKLYAWRKAVSDTELRTAFGIDDDTIVYLGDAFDVLYFQTRDEVVRRFRRLEAERGDGLIVISSERNCWPWMWNATEEIIQGGKEMCENFPRAPSSYRYLNSGNLMGRAKNVVALLNDVIDRLKNQDENYRLTINEEFLRHMNKTVWHSPSSLEELAENFGKVFKEDDQLILAKAFLGQFDDSTPSSAKYKIALDYKQELFHSAFRGGLASANYTQYKQNDTYYDASHVEVVNTETHVSPAIVHFNGAKTNFYSLGRHLITHTQRDERYFEIKAALAKRYGAFKDECDEVIDHLTRDDWNEWLVETLSPHRAETQASSDK